MRNLNSRFPGILFYAAVLITLALPLCTSAGIPEPPMILLGKLETSGGLQVTSGNLQFRFTPTGGGTTVSIDAVVDSFGSNYSFYAIIPLESPLSGSVSEGTLKFDGSTTYTPSVRYEGTTVSSSLPTPFVPQRAGLVDLNSIIVQPQGPKVATSAGVNFGYVPVGSSLDKEFLLWNVGDATLTGSIRLEEGSVFNLIEDGNPVNEITINLASGQTLTVIIRLEPSVADSTLSDSLQVRTNGGNVDRSVYGNSATPVQPADCDIDENGVVDQMDLFILIQNWQMPSGSLDPRTDFDGDNDCDEVDFLIFIGQWHEQPGS